MRKGNLFLVLIAIAMRGVAAYLAREWIAARAVSVRVVDVRGVAGFVLPGDRVDIVLLRSVPGPSGSKENISDVLLQHVKVLAVDQLANEQQEKPTIARAVTLELDTDQAQKILLATDVGKLALILRQAGESNPAD